MLGYQTLKGIVVVCLVNTEFSVVCVLSSSQSQGDNEDTTPSTLHLSL